MPHLNSGVPSSFFRRPETNRARRGLACRRFRTPTRSESHFVILVRKAPVLTTAGPFFLASGDLSTALG